MENGKWRIGKGMLSLRALSLSKGVAISAAGIASVYANALRPATAGQDIQPIVRDDILGPYSEI
jgi:hypothetical protein